MNQKSTLISIIVPIYNVEDYLSKCLDSLTALKPLKLSPTLASQNVNAESDTLIYNEIEIILVDDGSTDRCGQIADEYAERNSNFFVYHTENRGLSAARNYGIEKSHGKWLMFVDSDDWVDPNFCNLPFQTMLEYNAEIVIFHTFEGKEDGTFVENERKYPVGKISQEDALAYGENTVWNKIYKRELFKEIRFPEGRVYEDVATTCKLIYKAKNIVMIENTLIYHTFRANSIFHTTNISNINDYFDAFIQRYIFLSEQSYPQQKNKLDYQFAAYRYCLSINPSDDVRYKLAKKILDELESVPKDYPIRFRCMLRIWKINKNLFHFLCRIFGKKVSE